MSAWEKDTEERLDKLEKNNKRLEEHRVLGNKTMTKYLNKKAEEFSELKEQIRQNAGNCKYSHKERVKEIDGLKEQQENDNMIIKNLVSSLDVLEEQQEALHEAITNESKVSLRIEEVLQDLLTIYQPSLLAKLTGGEKSVEVLRQHPVVDQQIKAGGRFDSVADSKPPSIDKHTPIGKIAKILGFGYKNPSEPSCRHKDAVRSSHPAYWYNCTHCGAHLNQKFEEVKSIEVNCGGHDVDNFYPPDKDCNKCDDYGECDHQGAYQKDGIWCYEEKDIHPELKDALKRYGLEKEPPKDSTDDSKVYHEDQGTSTRQTERVSVDIRRAFPDIYNEDGTLKEKEPSKDPYPSPYSKEQDNFGKYIQVEIVDLKRIFKMIWNPSPCWLGYYFELKEKYFRGGKRNE